MRNIAVILMGCVLLSGCAKVSHLDQLLTLKGLADEQGEVNKYIEDQDKNFDLMLKEAEAGTLDQYTDKSKILQAFGEPVFMREVTDGEEELESWLYRYATRYFDSAKIYLYFNAEGNLVRSEYIEGRDGESREETTPENEREEI